MLNNFTSRSPRNYILEMELMPGVTFSIPVTEFTFEVKMMNTVDSPHLPAYVILVGRNDSGYYDSRYEVASYKLHKV